MTSKTDILVIIICLFSAVSGWAYGFWLHIKYHGLKKEVVELAEKNDNFNYKYNILIEQIIENGRILQLSEETINNMLKTLDYDSLFKANKNFEEGIKKHKLTK